MSRAANTMLAVAAKSNNIGNVHLAISEGADVNIYETVDKAPLLLAARAGNTEIVELLLANGARTSVKDLLGETALHHAADRGHAGVVRALIEHGADVNTIGYEGRTALSEAAVHGNKNIVKLLLNAGADPTLKDDRGKTARDRGSYYPRVSMMLRRAESAWTRNAAKQSQTLELEAAPRPEEASREDLGAAYQAMQAVYDESVVSVAATAEIGVSEPKQVIGEHTRRIIEAATAVRAEHDALESMTKAVLQDKFLGEMAYRGTLGEEQFHLLENAGVSVERRYENGPEPKWQVELWTGSIEEDLVRTMDAIRVKFDESLGIKTAAVRDGRRVISIPFRENLDEVVEAFNTALSEPIAKIDMGELRAAAKATAQQKTKQQDLAR